MPSLRDPHREFRPPESRTFSMARTPSLAERYTFDQISSDDAAGQAFLGEDRRLGRRVLLRVVECVEEPGERHLALARRLARLKDPAYLQVLDIVPSPGKVV